MDYRAVRERLEVSDPIGTSLLMGVPLARCCHFLPDRQFLDLRSPPLSAVCFVRLAVSRAGGTRVAVRRI